MAGPAIFLDDAVTVENRYAGAAIPAHGAEAMNAHAATLSDAQP